MISFFLSFFSFSGGILVFFLLHKVKTGGFEKLAKQIVDEAEKQAMAKLSESQLKTQEKEFAHRRFLDTLTNDQKIAQQKAEQKLEKREEKLDYHLSMVEKKLNFLEGKEGKLTRQSDELTRKQASLEKEKEAYFSKIEKLSQMTCKEAKVLLLESLSQEVQTEIGKKTRRILQEAEEEAETSATRIITTALNRIAIPTVSDVAICTVPLPNQEIKGRVIGREGRNIRALEQATGVSFLVDDTPNTIVISGYDPVRKEIAKFALKELISDGRIHPSRIEEVVAKGEKAIEKQILQYGEDAAFQVGCPDLHPELLTLLGKLQFRFSFGQNVREHSLEVSHLMGIMASELNLDAPLAKRIGLLHDIGKALSHEHEGSHALLGYELALKHGEKPEVANGIGCHHEEMLPETLEASLCSAADKLSSGRPGARAPALAQYLKRSRKLEALSYQFAGVEKAYVLQAGRELRVLVEPDSLDDTATFQLARDLAKRIEKEMSYPGKIKVTVIREKRAVEYAT
ncbi:MAG: Ribonuclease Y [Chlamydiae bacterium]|nr:Ribonuclease Y [Chlamydiota bacterium]